MTKKKLLVVFHSQSGATRQLADAVLEGAAQEDVQITVKRAYEATSADLLAADGVLFGTPENLGYMSGALKDFFDRSYYAVQPHQLNIPYALFISAGNDGSGAVREIDRILRGYPLKKIAEPVVVKGLPSNDGLQACHELGQSMAAGLAMGIF